jgi:hypothetical protein
MLQHPEVALAHAHDRHRELVARADRYRLFAVVRRRNRGTVVSDAARGRPATTPVGIRAAAPAC